MINLEQLLKRPDLYMKSTINDISIIENFSFMGGPVNRPYNRVTSFSLFFCGQTGSHSPVQGEKSRKIDTFSSLRVPRDRDLYFGSVHSFFEN